ncbi:hypothetical protein R3I94_002535 [Phoxinus phoxinus]
MLLLNKIRATGPGRATRWDTSSPGTAICLKKIMTRPSKDPLGGLSQSNPLHMKPVQGLVGTYDFQCPWQNFKKKF